MAMLRGDEERQRWDGFADEINALERYGRTTRMGVDGMWCRALRKTLRNAAQCSAELVREPPPRLAR